MKTRARRAAENHDGKYENKKTQEMFEQKNREGRELGRRKGQLINLDTYRQK